MLELLQQPSFRAALKRADFKEMVKKLKLPASALDLRKLDPRMTNESTFDTSIRVFLEYRSASMPVNGSMGAKVKLRTARTPAMARGESSVASAASRNMAMTENQSPVNITISLVNSLRKFRFPLSSST